MLCKIVRKVKVWIDGWIKVEDRWRRGDEIGITTILGPSILQGGQEYPLKVHQRQPADRLKSVSTDSAPSRPRRPRCKSGDGIISPVVMIIAQHRGVSRRIAPSRPENWLFCIIMTSPSSPRFPYPASLPLFAHATDSPNVHPLLLPSPPPLDSKSRSPDFPLDFLEKL